MVGLRKEAALVTTVVESKWTLPDHQNYQTGLVNVVAVVETLAAVLRDEDSSHVVRRGQSTLFTLCQTTPKLAVQPSFS